MPTIAIIPRLLGALALLAFATTAEIAAADEAWTPLFDGQTLNGWETWLGMPGGTKVPLGLNQDPLHTFSVEDGCVHISGEVFGALSTLAEYGNYHLRLEQKWGTKRWPPRDHAIRDSGICYLATGRHGAYGGHWMASVECQVQESEIGDTFLLAGPLIAVHGERGEFPDAASGKTKTAPLFKPAAPLVTVHSGRIVRSQTNEKPPGEWNVIEVICHGGTCTHIVNGTTVMVMENPRLVIDSIEQPLLKGHIQLQSEGAEVWYRKIEIQLLDH